MTGDFDPDRIAKKSLTCLVPDAIERARRDRRLACPQQSMLGAEAEAERGARNDGERSAAHRSFSEALTQN